MVCYVDPQRTLLAEGRVDGTILRDPRGKGGFGYDPVFLPDGKSRTFAEMSPEEKHAISHRGRALERLKEILAPLLEERSDDCG